MMATKSRAWIELDRNNLAHNVSFFRQILPKNCRLMPAVKAEAYGHGAVLIARELQKLGITDFCVASAEEGIQLRKAGIKGQILILGYTHPQALEDVAVWQLTQTVVDSAYAKKLRGYGGVIQVHIGIDTGMHRLGESSDHITEILKICQQPNLIVTGVFSHLCVADSGKAEDEAFTRLQLARFDKLIESLRAAGMAKIKTHMLSSYGILNYPESNYDYARCGIALYGLMSSEHSRTGILPDLVPVLSLKARVTCIKQLKSGESAGYDFAYTADGNRVLAVLSIGYGDGVPRNIAKQGYALIHGKKAKIAGCICMDQMFVDVTDIREAAPGEEAILIGTSGKEIITAEMYAAWAGTITNEIVSRLGSRLERCVKEEAQVSKEKEGKKFHSNKIP